MSYNRVIPRDFFNEAKLLKCLGRLSLLILDNRNGLAQYLEDDFDNEPFQIEQTQDGDIYVVNYHVFLKGTENELELTTPLNSKLNYPLMFGLGKIYVAEFVFDDDGNPTKEFMRFVKAYGA